MLIKGFSLGNNEDGRLEVIGLSAEPSDELWHCWELHEDSMRFSNWVKFEGRSPRTRQVVVGQNSRGCLEVFAVGWDRKIHHVRQVSKNNGWSSWRLLAEPADQITVGVGIGGGLELFVLNENPAIFHLSQNSNNEEWESSLTPFALSSGFRIIKARRNRFGGLALFALTQDYTLLCVQQNSEGQWDWDVQENHSRLIRPPKWKTVARDAGDYVIGQNQDGRLEIFWISHGQVMHSWETESVNVWSAPNNLIGPSTVGAPTFPIQLSVARNAEGRLELFANDRSTNRIVRHIFQVAPNDGWGDWEETGFGYRGFIEAGCARNGRVYLFSITDRQMIDCEYGDIKMDLPDPLAIVTPGLPEAWAQENYQFTLNAEGGVVPYSWSIKQGRLPEGLELARTGIISGRPTNAGPCSLTIQCCDATGVSDDKSYNLLVQPVRPPTIMTVSPLPPATKNKRYTFNLLAAGGVVPYYWSIVSGSLPMGLSLDQQHAGLLSGVPTATTVASFTLRCAGGGPNGLSSERFYSLAVVEEPVVEEPVDRAYPLFCQTPAYGGKYYCFNTIPGSGRLVRIKVPNDNWTILNIIEVKFIKAGHSSEECDVESAVVRLKPGESTTPSQMIELFTIAEPPLPRTVGVCLSLTPYSVYDTRNPTYQKLECLYITFYVKE